MSEVTSTATPAPQSAAGPMSLSSVVVHPLVLLSVVDHYNRVARDTRKRVVGVLLGSTHRGGERRSSEAKGEGPLYYQSD